MPEPLWNAATALARKDGVYATSRALGVNYGSLKSRTLAGAGREEAEPTVRAGFVELSPGPPVGWTQPAGAVVELSDPDGTKLVIRLAQATELDVASLAKAFWSRGS
jgi:hypothetical protein